MDSGEWLTRGTVWAALSLCVAAEAVMAKQSGLRGIITARWLNTCGVVVFLGHVAAAFHHYHHWSHAAAHADTARQTAEFSGWNWGGGLYLNYLFALVWLGDAIWNWASLHTWLQRPYWISRTIRGFFIFMIFNGAVVFVQNPARWYGLILCLILAVCWWRTWKRQTNKTQPESA